MNYKKFNIIGFDFQYSRISNERWKHCPIHSGTRVISKPDEPGTLYCPLCGTTFLEKEAPPEEGITPKHGKQETRIITPKSIKKYYDQKGNEINDEQLLKDIANGAHVISYNEVKQGQDVTIDKQTRRIIRTRK